AGRERHLARLVDVGDGRGVSELGERRAVRGEHGFGRIAEAHEGLFAALLACARQPRTDLLALHGPRAGIAGILPKRTVAAAIAAKIGDRQEDLAGVRHMSTLVTVA